MYNFKQIEKKWQNYWEENKCFKAEDDFSKKKFYSLVEFPYPSGAGMHVGHIKAYSGLEVVSRKRRMEGYNVLFPIGFDAFGLPTENYAIKTNTHPRIVTDNNIKRFTEQLKSVGFSFDYDRVVDTTDENYYKWTQWIFMKMFDNGLVFRDIAYVNYCPSCKVVLSNEDSQGGKCDICHSEVVQKEKKVWYLRITDYADKLLEGLKEVDYLPNVRLQQENWIGKSTGAFVNFKLKGLDETLKIYTKLTNHRNYFAHLDKKRKRFYGDSNLYMLLKIKLLFRVFILNDINQTIEIDNLKKCVNEIEKYIKRRK